MRRIIAVAVLGACAPRFDRTAHTGLDGQRSGARVIQLDDDGHGRAHGIVTARGGDSVDWVAFDVPRPSSCSVVSIDVELRWKPARPDLHLGFAMFDAAGHDWHPTRRGVRSTELSIDQVPSGRYLAKVFAPGRDDAGAYALDVRTEPSPWCGEGPPPSMLQIARPADLIAPTLSPPPGHVIADVRAYDLDERMTAVTIEAAAGTARGIGEGWMGRLVDDTGAPIRRGEVLVVQASDDRSIAGLLDGLPFAKDPEPVGNAWTLELWPPPPSALPPVHHAPIHAAVTDVHQTLGGTIVEIDRGSADGVAPGWGVQLVDASGAPLGEPVRVEWVDVHRALGYADGISPPQPAPTSAIVAPRS